MGTQDTMTMSGVRGRSGPFMEHWVILGVLAGVTGPLGVCGWLIYYPSAVGKTMTKRIVLGVWLLAMVLFLGGQQLFGYPPAWYITLALMLGWILAAYLTFWFCRLLSLMYLSRFGHVR